MAREYKDSGIEWIGQIPKEWKVCLTSMLFHEHKEKNSGLKETNLLSLSYGAIKRKDINTNEGLLPQSFETYNVIKKGDIIFRLTDLQNDKRSLRTGLCKENGIITSAYVTLRANKELNSAYFHYLFHSYDICKVFYGLGDGVRQGMNWEDVRKVMIFLPSLSEQQKIANYLDKVCGEVDEMVALQETMIEELKAYKQSVITEAVTKGLDPNVPMRNSGIDWIEEIPEGWKVCRIKNVASLFGRIGFRGYTSDDLNKDGIGAITLSPSNMKPMGMDYQHVTFLSWKKYEESPEIMIQNEDLLMVKTGSSYGKVSYVSNLPREATINPQILRIVPSILSKYLGYYMQTPLFLYQVEGGVVGGTIPTISQEKINNFYVVLPKGNEQCAIASFLDTKCSEIDSLIALKQTKIEELKEYKKSVIYEYVTGKKEVV